MKSLFEKWKPSIELVIWDAHAGELIVNFAELKKDAKGVFPRGWSLPQLDAGLKKLGLKYEILSPATL